MVLVLLVGAVAAYRDAEMMQPSPSPDAEMVGDMLRSSVSPTAETGAAVTNDTDVDEGEALEWGIRLDFMLDHTRGAVFNWPRGEHESWPSRKPIKKPDWHDFDDEFDPHTPLKLVDTGPLVALGKKEAPYDEIVAAAKTLFMPFLQRMARWIPDGKHATTRIMLLVSGREIRRLTEAQQCPLWYAMRDVLKASPFTSGLVHLVSIPNVAPFHPRECRKVKWA